jgi:CubicO group peptidase (beta-lactamase class C family)
MVFMKRAKPSITITTTAIACLAVLLSCSGEPTAPPVTPPVTTPPQQEIPITGAQVTGMEPYEQSVRDLMKKYNIPGGAIAVVRDGKLFYARGFGFADVENKTPVQPDALFRIASVSKPITSAAIMKLVEEGRLKLDDRVAPFIAHLVPAEGATVDPRWDQITIRQLLNHTGGWDRNKPNGGFDPIDRPAIAAAAVNAPAPASSETLIRYMKGMPLDFNPGEKHAYSNFGYIVLGRVIERLSGMRYEDYVRARVLVPVGASRTQQGKSRMKDALPDEVKYYLPGAGLNFPMVQSVFPGEGLVPLNYGGYHLEAGDASGAWVSSTIDLLRFVVKVDGRASPPDILSAGLVAEMTSNGATLCPDGSCYYAGGWVVRPVQNGATWSHGGDLPGTKSILVRSFYNISWVALFNTSAPNSFIGELDAALWQSLNGMTSFPTQDLFSAFR